jgi:hypothetical protein
VILRRGAGRRGVWKYVKDDVQAILSRIERLKTLAQIVLQMDYLSVSLSTNS